MATGHAGPKRALAPQQIRVNDVLLYPIRGEPTNVRVEKIEKIGGQYQITYSVRNLTTGQSFMVRTAARFLGRADNGPGVDRDAFGEGLAAEYRKRLGYIERQTRGYATRLAKGIKSIPPPPRRSSGKVYTPSHKGDLAVTVHHQVPTYVHPSSKELNDQAKLLAVAARQIAELVDRVNELTTRVEGLEKTLVEVMKEFFPSK